jgi:alcohol dehydrogenase
MTQTVLTRIEDLAAILRIAGPTELLLVADRHAYAQSGASARLQPILVDYRVSIFSDFEPNPEAAHAERCFEKLPPGGNLTVIAIGGGSAIDMAKLICFLHAGNRRTEAWWSQRENLVPRTARLIAIPTTAGTGSEATHFAVVYTAGVKHSVAHPSLLPDLVVLDPSLTYSLPPSITAATGLDAVTQAFESLWSRRATPESSDYAEQSLRIGLKHLAKAVTRPAPADRQAMLDAAHLSGKAINVSRTTAAHALSYKLTSRYGVPHGYAVALSLLALLRAPRVATFSAEHDNRLTTAMGTIYAAFAIHPTSHDAQTSLAAAWHELLTAVGCPTTLAACGLRNDEELTELARAANAERLANHPTPLTTDQLEQALKFVR